MTESHRSRRPLNAACFNKSRLQIPTAQIICPYSDPTFWAASMDFNRFVPFFFRVNKFTNHKKPLQAGSRVPGLAGTRSLWLCLTRHGARDDVYPCVFLQGHICTSSTILIAPKGRELCAFNPLSPPGLRNGVEPCEQLKLLAGELAPHLLSGSLSHHILEEGASETRALRMGKKEMRFASGGWVPSQSRCGYEKNPAGLAGAPSAFTKPLPAPLFAQRPNSLGGRVSDPRGANWVLCHLESEFKRLLGGPSQPGSSGLQEAPRLASRCPMLPPAGGSGAQPSRPGLAGSGPLPPKPERWLFIT